jgi:hypothetical protein
MNLEERKLSLIEWLAALDDKATIDKIESLKKAKAAKQEMKPMPLKKFYAMIEESEGDIRSGKVYAHEKVAKYLKRKR